MKEIISDMIENGVSEEEAICASGERQKKITGRRNFAGENAVKKRVQNWLDRFCFNYFDPFIGNSVRISDVSEYRIKSEFAEIHTEIANETVSITGGSDGPTSVFLAGKITFWVRPDILIVITSNDGYNYN